jgi:putative hydrolase of the HAD superfamily
MAKKIGVVAFDGDDTLWRNEDHFTISQDRFRTIIGAHVQLDSAVLDAHLLETERRNLALYGYGVKSFVLSMIETAIELTGAAIPASDIQILLRLGQKMLAHPIELMYGVRETIEELRKGGHEIWLITKGDLFDQESKIARSGLEPLFDRIEIVSEKNQATYRRLLDRHGVEASEFLMVGNTLRSDVLPVAALGAHAVHIPYHMTWAHETVEPALAETSAYLTLMHVTELPAALQRLSAPFV